MGLLLCSMPWQVDWVLYKKVLLLNERVFVTCLGHARFEIIGFKSVIFLYDCITICLAKSNSSEKACLRVKWFKMLGVWED